ncbi:MAG: hypothetical protein JSS57_05485 [Proteobacteria bacterium]|nr:hypothetical protein [Pseudomonadota bacterium]
MLLAIIVVLVIFGLLLLFGVIATLVEMIVGLALLAGVVALTITFPYVMIPLILIGYFFGQKNKKSELRKD